MRNIQITLYKFAELSEKAQENAIEKLSDINVDYDWWNYTYEEAETVGLSLTSFDLHNGRHATGAFILTAPEVAEKILVEHGETCETYKTAKTFLSDLEALTGAHENIEDVNEDEVEELEEQFLKDILEDYLILLQKDFEFLQSRDAIVETIEANEYEFTEDGDLN